MNDGISPRAPDGTFLAGTVPNPTGSNGHLKGWQRYGSRIQKWLNLPAEEMAKYAADESLIMRESVIDAICIRHVLNSLGGKAVLAERKELLDRIEGTPKQTIEHQGSKDQPLYPAETKSVDEASQAYLSAIKGS